MDQFCIFVSNSGTEFNSVPDLIVEDSSGSGLGGKLRAEISVVKYQMLS